MGLFKRYGPVPFDPKRSPIDLIFETLRIYVGQKYQLTADRRVTEDLGIRGDDRDELFQFLGTTFSRSLSREDQRAVRDVADLVRFYSSTGTCDTGFKS